MCALFGDFLFCLVNELCKCVFDLVILSCNSELLKFFVGAGEGVVLLGSSLWYLPKCGGL